MWEVMGEGPVVWRFVALPAGSHAGYVWHWLCENGRGEVVDRSSGGYRYYYDCLEDARSHGYGGLPRSVAEAHSSAPVPKHEDDPQGVNT